MSESKQEEFDPVEVIVHFSKLKMQIIKFKWNGSTYKVTEMLQSWKIPNGPGFITHFIVTCKEQELLCELSFCNTDMKWELVRSDNIS